MANPTNVSELYTSIGLALPSVKDRIAPATKAGILDYTGTAQQNQQYFSYYSKNPESLRTTTPQIPQLAATSTPQPIAIDSLNVKQPSIPTAPLPAEIQPSQNFAQSLLDSVQTQETALQKEVNGLSSKIYNLIPELGGQSDALAKAQEAAGVTSIKNNLNTINSEINFKMAELRKDDVSLAKSLQDIEDKPVALEFITGEQASVQRNAQIARAWKNAEIDTLNARALAVRGDLELAQDMAQKAVDAKYKPIEEAINLYQKQLDSLKPLLDREETKIASERQLKIDLALTDWKEKKVNEKAVADLITKAAGQQTDGYKIPPDVLAKASKAKTPMEAAIALGQWAGDYWQNKALEDAYKKQQTANTQAQIVSGNYVSAMEKYDATPAQLAQAIAMKETNGGRNITAGASGELASKYQYMPETWRTTSQAYNLAVNGKNSPLPFSLDVEDKVTEWQIAKWKAEGKTNAQIFAMWNGGPGAANNWQNRVGVNSKGVKYDVPSYVSGASKFLADIVGVGGGASVGSAVVSKEAQVYIDRIMSGQTSYEDVLKSLGTSKATLDLRTEVTRGFNAMGGMNPATIQILQDRLTAVENIEKLADQYFGISLKKNPLNSEYVTFQADLNALVSSLTMDNLGVLKGPLSDGDRLFIQQASTVLSNDNITPTRAKEELKKISDRLTQRLSPFQSTTQDNTTTPAVTGNSRVDAQLLQASQNLSTMTTSTMPISTLRQSLKN